MAILLREPGGQEILGGLWGNIAFKWLFVELLCVSSGLRREDLGTRLLSEAEQIARQKNGVGVWLDTFSFQAPAFYPKRGYEVFGTLDDYPPGSQRFFFYKRLDTSA